MNDIYRIKISRDNDPSDPREDDNLGTMFCRHRRYNLGDHHRFKSKRDWDIEDVLLDVMVDDELLPEGFRDTLVDEDGNDLPSDERRKKIQALFDTLYVTLPLSLYDHSGISMRVGVIGIPWDSGPVGIIFVSHERMKSEHGHEAFKAEGWTAEMQKITEGCLIAEVENYDQFIGGDCYGFEIEKLVYEFEHPAEESIDPTDDSLPWVAEDSCWGFFGSDLDGKKANGMIDHIMFNDGDGRLDAVKTAMHNQDTWTLLPPLMKKEEHVSA